MKKFIVIIIILIVASLAWSYKNRGPKVLEADLPLAQDYQEFVNTNTIPEEVATNTVEVVEEPYIESVEEPVVVQTSINLDVPFTSQAPTADWVQPFQDACEEASLLMVDYYYQNQDLPDVEQVEVVLLDMIGWQQEMWEGHFNLTLDDLDDFVKTNTEYRTEIVEDLTIEKIKSYLNRGLPLIVPADGTKLANPFFKNGGPDYHMLVIKGYTEDKIITNDPGTSRGADFIYTYENMLYSIADWNKKESLATGPKRALILYRD
jgi:hypothetical protein